MTKKKEKFLLDNQDWLEEFIPSLVGEMLRLGFTSRAIAKYLARTFYFLDELREEVEEGREPEKVEKGQLR